MMKYKLVKSIEKIYRHILWHFYSLIPNRGIHIPAEEWDYLIILDGCRYDEFEKLNDIEGRLEKKISSGSGTKEWLVNNFQRYYDDIVYVSANPYISGYELRHTHRIKGWRGTDHFFKVENVWKYGWSEELGTTLPHEVTKAALRMKKNYPNKRMIVHYMKPHGPWIGKTRLSAKEIPKNLGGGRPDGFVPGAFYFWDKVKFGEMNIEIIKQAYRDNLRLVLKEVKKLVKELDGRVIISADHGTSFGEKLIYAHPLFIHTKELVEVPWLIIVKGGRRLVQK